MEFHQAFIVTWLVDQGALVELQAVEAVYALNGPGLASFGNGHDLFRKFNGSIEGIEDRENNFTLKKGRSF